MTSTLSNSEEPLKDVEDVKYPQTFEELPESLQKQLRFDVRKPQPSAGVGFIGNRRPVPSPPDDKRCTHVHRFTGKRCKKWAVSGTQRCETHGVHHVHRAGRAAPKIHQLPVFYAKVLGPTLKQALAQCVEQPDAELLSLREELGMMRVLALDGVALYNAVCEMPNATHDQRLTAGQVVRDLLNNVASLCEKAAHVNGLGKDKISLQNIVVISNQLVQVAHEVFGEDDRVMEFQRLIQEKVRLPADDCGTSISPDQDVIEMDSTIPREAEDIRVA